MIRDLAFVLVLAAAACGGKQSAPATTATAQPADNGAPAGDQHESMPRELANFHDVLAPRWHAEKGPQRMQDTCAALPQFQAEADAIAKATPPTTANADTWTAGTRALVDAVARLDASCTANDTAKFEDAFHQLHERFHALMAAAGMKHAPGPHPHGAEHGM